MFALLQMIHSDEKRKRDPLLPFIYLNLINANRKKGRKVKNNGVLIKKRRKGFLRFITKPSQT